MDIHTQGEGRDKDQELVATEVPHDGNITVYNSLDMSLTQVDSSPLTQTTSHSYEGDSVGKDQTCRVCEGPAPSRGLKYDKCESRVHYKCSQLPQTQLMNFDGLNR